MLQLQRIATRAARTEVGRRAAATALGRRHKTGQLRPARTGDLPLEHCVTWAGRTFAAVPLADPKGIPSTFDTDQWHTIPSGWDIAGAEEGLEANVLSPYGWNALALITHNGGKYQGLCTGNAGTGVWEEDASQRMVRDGATIKLKLGGMRLLLERKASGATC